ncbi:FAD-dependent oxidoreductase [Thermococcus sp.]|uniref:FAD-dependent oxidoreductase n=1 Tax=Thermococcus sp. TaxID=35749 RepID=UPI0025FE159C|nr:FAD-dependent oxidoreductase [Thermococcus sp.]
MENYDFLIVDGGTAGFAAALKADELGVKTLMVNRGPIGGTCVNVGCVPTKYLLTALELKRRALFSPYPGLGFSVEGFDFAKLVEGKDRLVKTLRKEKHEDILQSLEHVDYVKGLRQVRLGKHRGGERGQNRVQKGPHSDRLAGEGSPAEGAGGG